MFPKSLVVVTFLVLIEDIHACGACCFCQHCCCSSNLCCSWCDGICQANPGCDHNCVASCATTNFSVVSRVPSSLFQQENTIIRVESPGWIGASFLSALDCKEAIYQNSNNSNLAIVDLCDSSNSKVQFGCTQRVCEVKKTPLAFDINAVGCVGRLVSNSFSSEDTALGYIITIVSGSWISFSLPDVMTCRLMVKEQTDSSLIVIDLCGSLHLQLGCGAGTCSAVALSNVSYPAVVGCFPVEDQLWQGLASFNQKKKNVFVP